MIEYREESKRLKRRIKMKKKKKEKKKEMFFSHAAGSIRKSTSSTCTLLVNISTRYHTVVYCGITSHPF